MRAILIFFFVLLYSTGNAQHSILPLDGSWQVKLDEDNELVKKFPERCKIEGLIELPASLAEKGFGYKTEGADFGSLTPEYKYIGKAWYTKEIEIPDSWINKDIELFLERVLWESRVFIDGKELTRQDALGTPHVHRVGKIAPGKHKITILVNNEMIHNIGNKGHAYGEATQSIWNGITGKMELRAFDPIRIESVRTFPDINNDELKIEFRIKSESIKKIKVGYSIISVTAGKEVLQGEIKRQLSAENNLFFVNIPVNGRMKKWSEFNPEVYILRTNLDSGKFTDMHETEFGFYQVGHDGTKVLINNKPVFLRGNLDCVHFPLTGYASCSVGDWERIFRIYKEYGFNHARFHAWCPPEAAFKAANRIGIYLQAEASVWIDSWMEDPERGVRGRPKGLGHDAARDSFVIAEMNRVVDFYGNHPSFTMFCIGNELGSGDFDVMKEWVADLKEKDPRRLYAVSTAREITEVDDYSATHRIQDIGRTRGLNGPRTNWDFEETYAKMNIPIIAHEIGQWPVYPRWSEIDKYTGVLKARNLEDFRDQAELNGIAHQDEQFARASGALNQIMYKYEIESFFRTASCAGIQLLSMQDYQGQGEALIGWLDSHWDSKSITTPEKFRQHHNTTVPLLRMDKYVWTTDEVFQATAQVSHHGESPLNATGRWKINKQNGKIIAGGNFGVNSFPVGSLTDLGKIEFDLNTFTRPEKLTVTIELEETEFRNQWDIWVYPSSISETKHNEIIITDELNEETLSHLRNGAKVLLLAHELGTEESSVFANYYPLYWSLTWFPGQGKTCIGLLLDSDHPAFNNFPTSFHSDWQWESISNDARAFILNDMPASFRPIAQPVNDFHLNNKLGSIFELKTGTGKLLVSGYNLNSGLPAARQLKKSILNYMASSQFNPQQQADPEWLLDIMPLLPDAGLTE